MERHDSHEIKFIDVWKRYMPSPMPDQMNLYSWCERFWEEGLARGKETNARLISELSRKETFNEELLQELAKCRDLFEFGEDMIPAIGEPLEVAYFIESRLKNGLPAAWRTFDGEGGYEYRSYEGNEDYLQWWEEHHPNHKGWVKPLYLVSSPQPSQLEPRTNEQKPLDPGSVLETLQREEFIERDVL